MDGPRGFTSREGMRREDHGGWLERVKGIEPSS